MLARLLRSVLPGSVPVASRPRGAPGSLIAFITSVDRVRFLPEEPTFARLASTRLRTLIPAGELARRARVALVPWAALLDESIFAAVGMPEALVISKLATSEVLVHWARLRVALERLRELRGRTRLVADVSDDYAAMAEALGQPSLAAYQRALAETCTLTVPCDALAQQLRPIARHGIRVIEDPWESPRSGNPALRCGEPLRLLWFGNLGETNAGVVERGLGLALSGLRGRRAQVDVATGPERRGLVGQMAERLARDFPAAPLGFVEWSPEAVWSGLEACDLVLLPQDRAGDWGRVKSHNRLVETIRAGRLAIASPIPSYTELAAYAWVGEDLGRGVDWALAHPREAERRVAAGQAHIATRFAPEVVGRKWAAVLGLDPADGAD